LLGASTGIGGFMSDDGFHACSQILQLANFVFAELIVAFFPFDDGDHLVDLADDVGQ